MATTSKQTNTKTDNYHVIAMTAEEVEKRLFKTKELDLFKPPAEEAVDYIKVNVDYPIEDGSSIKFRSPVDCSKVIGLKVSYPDAIGLAKSNSEKTFIFTDAHGKDVSNINELFKADVAVEAILHDLEAEQPKAYVLNADTNAYLEGRFKDLSANQPELILWAEDDTHEMLNNL